MSNNRTLFSRYAVFSLLFIILCWFVVTRECHEWDMYCFTEWANHIQKYGLGNVYSSWTDYLPLFHHVLNFFVSFHDTPGEIKSNIHLLKLISLAFHLLTGCFVILFCLRVGMDRETAAFRNMYYVLNAAVLYNALVWNQMDIPLTCFVFISVYCAATGRPVLSLIALLLGLNFKLQAIIFIPVIGLLVLPQLFSRGTFKRLGLALALLAVTEVLILIPFILTGQVARIPGVIYESVDKYPVVSIYAFNFWNLVVPGDLFKTPDTLEAAGISYKTWGLLMFLAASTVVMFPLLRTTWLSLKKGIFIQLPLTKLLLICGLIPLVFFYFNTQMHERYSHPALAFVITYCIITSRPLPGILSSVAYLLNLEAETRYMALPNYGTAVFDPRFVSGLYLITIVMLVVRLYRAEPDRNAIEVAGMG